MIAIIHAYYWEISGLIKSIQNIEKKYIERFKFITGKVNKKDIIAVRTGQGKENAKKATEFLLDNFDIKIIISTGFCGATAQELKEGDIVVSEISTPPIVERFKNIKIPFHFGKTLTVDKIIESKEDKKKLGESHGVVSVDMETSAIKDVANIKNIPLISIRAVFDRVDEDLPCGIKMFFYLWKFYNRTKLAEKNLSSTMKKFVEVL